jgi:hypothetical protein
MPVVRLAKAVVLQPKPARITSLQNHIESIVKMVSVV